ncbi:MAG: hypothetical protein CL663_08740 [Bacteroidetes bacterium]|nr:hypothetical protein [Bacteroidota bacterium]
MNPLLINMLYRIIVLLVLMTFCFSGIAQESRIELKDVYISNKLTDKAIQIGDPDSLLIDFGGLTSIDSINPMEFINDQVVIYRFGDTYFEVSSKSRILSYRIRSSNIALEVKGKFSVSPCDHIDKISSALEYEVNKAVLYNSKGVDYLWVSIHFKHFNELLGDHQIEDVKVNLKFDPLSKQLVEVHYWIRP